MPPPTPPALEVVDSHGHAVSVATPHQYRLEGIEFVVGSGKEFEIGSPSTPPFAARAQDRPYQFMDRRFRFPRRRQAEESSACSPRTFAEIHGSSEVFSTPHRLRSRRPLAARVPPNRPPGSRRGAAFDASGTPGWWWISPNFLGQPGSTRGPWRRRCPRRCRGRCRPPLRVEGVHQQDELVVLTAGRVQVLVAALARVLPGDEESYAATGVSGIGLQCGGSTALTRRVRPRSRPAAGRPRSAREA